MAFTAKILSLRFRHLNIVGCLLKKRPTKGAVTGTPGPPPPPGYAPESILQLVWRFCCETGSFRARYTKRS